MRTVFDELTRFATRLPLVRFPEDHWNAITSCMATAGDTLYPSASDAAWMGWTQFGIDGGASDDPWDIHNRAGWMEYDPRNLTHKGHHIPIIEPCNTVSNLAYYRIIPDLCGNRERLSMPDGYVNAIIQSFATLGMGSSFMHGSRTHLGGAFDNIPISVIAYQYFQYMSSPLVAAGDAGSILHELSATARAYDGRELATRLHTIPLELEVDEWHGALNKLDRPQYFFTFSAIIVNCLTLVAPDFLVDKLVPVLMSLFQLSDAVKTFILTKYIPSIRAATADVHLTLQEKAALMPKFAGTVLKLLWAFTWQECTFIYKQVYNAEWNVFGALLIPSVNRLANKLTGFAHPDDSIQRGESIYPGQDWCKLKHTAPHAKWHEISANGLMDLGYLADDVKVVVEKAVGRKASQTPSDGSEAPSDGSEVVFGTEVVKAWAAEVQASPWSEASVVSQAFARTVDSIVGHMDACSSGTADGAVTMRDLTCYLTSIDSGTGFVGMLYTNVSSHHEQALLQVGHTPNAEPILV
jgi:hypothetical protein